MKTYKTNILISINKIVNLPKDIEPLLGLWKIFEEPKLKSYKNIKNKLK